jgi:hypothetical protein
LIACAINSAQDDSRLGKQSVPDLVCGCVVANSEVIDLSTSPVATADFDCVDRQAINSAQEDSVFWLRISIVQMKKRTRVHPGALSCRLEMR